MATYYIKEYPYFVGGVDKTFSIRVDMRTGTSPDGEPTNTIKVTFNDGTSNEYAEITDRNVLSMIDALYKATIAFLDNIPNQELDDSLIADMFTRYNS